MPGPVASHIDRRRVGIVQDQSVDRGAIKSGQVRVEGLTSVLRRGGCCDRVVLRREIERAEAGTADVGDQRVAHVCRTEVAREALTDGPGDDADVLCSGRAATADQIVRVGDERRLIRGGADSELIVPGVSATEGGAADIERGVVEAEDVVSDDVGVIGGAIGAHSNVAGPTVDVHHAHDFVCRTVLVVVDGQTADSGACGDGSIRRVQRDRRGVQDASGRACGAGHVEEKDTALVHRDVGCSDGRGVRQPQSAAVNDDGASEAATGVLQIQVGGAVFDQGAASGEESRVGRARGVENPQRVSANGHRAVISANDADSLATLEATDGLVGQQLQRAVAIEGEGHDGDVTEGIATADLKGATVQLGLLLVIVVGPGEEKCASATLGDPLLGAKEGGDLKGLGTVLMNDELGHVRDEGASEDTRGTGSHLIGDKDAAAADEQDAIGGHVYRRTSRSVKAQGINIAR